MRNKIRDNYSSISPADDEASASKSTAPFHFWIRTLPDELLSEVLAAAVIISHQRLDDQIPRRRALPTHDFRTIVQLVCKKWRAVALHTPSLWSFIDTKMMRSSNLPLFLQRSGIMHLSINLNLTPSAGTREQLRLNFKLTVAEHGNRVSQVYLDGPYIPNLLGDLHPKLLNLRELVLAGGHLSDWTTIPICPSLDSLAIIELSAISVPQHIFFSTLEGFPRLRILQLANQDFDEWGDTDHVPQRFVLRELEKLTLRFFYIWEMTSIFNVIGTPRLNAFVSSGVSTREGQEPRLELVCPLLESLVLEGLASSLEIAQELSHVKNLAIIEIQHEDPQDVDELFQSLFAHWTSRSDPIPLETFKTDNIRLSTLLSFLEGHRYTAVPKLCKISVYYSKVFCSEDSGEFERRASDWSKLSSLVETEVYGIPAGAIESRMKVTSWEEEREWSQNLQTFPVGLL